MILYLRMDSIKPRRMFFRRLYVLSDTDIGCVVAVSYTHLDVYKRQSVIVITVSVTAVLFSIGKDNEDMYLAMQTITVPAGQRVTVSYTHLW